VTGLGFIHTGYKIIFNKTKLKAKKVKTSTIN